jgi:long-chain fatty acid transport protein
MNKLAPCLIILSLLISPSHVYAVGSGSFENASFSAESIGQVNAVVAQGDEPAAISYNPAGIIQLHGFQVQGSQNFIGMTTFYKGRNDDTTQSGGTLSYVPTAYATLHPGHLLGDRVAFGIGTDSPFGLANKYDSAHPVAHYVGYENAIKMFTVKPVAAIKLHEKLSVGAGPVFYRTFDVSTKLAYPNLLLGGAFPDGTLRANLNGNTWGWQMGVLAKPHEKHQLGFYFRSPALLRLHGRVRVENATVGGNFETGAGAKLNLPMNMTWAYAFKPTEKLTIESDFGYTRWSTLERLFIRTDSVNANDNALLAAVGHQAKDYDDGYSIHLGTKYRATEKWTLTAGSAFYWSVIPQDHWNVAIPDSNRLSFGAGTGYEFTKWLKMDLSYYVGLNLRRKIDNGSLDATGHTMDGRYFSYIHGIYISMTYKWEDLFNRDKNSGSYEPNQKTETPNVKLINPSGSSAVPLQGRVK